MRVLSWFFSCHHRRLSRILTIHDQTFQVCLACGERLPYCWETMSRVSERRPANGDVMPGYAEADNQRGHAL
jgi:hypothetical protein